MKISKIRCFGALLLMLSLSLMLLPAVHSGAQEHNSVPLDHPAYEIIELGIMRGVILPPPSARPWSERTVRQKLLEMISDPAQLLSIAEIDTVDFLLDSFERKEGLELKDGRYRAEYTEFTLETGLGWESVFSLNAPDTTFSTINVARLYAGGDIYDFVSWNVALLGEFLYIGRKYFGESPYTTMESYAIPSAFSYSFSKPWDGGVLSLRNPGTYAGWPDDPAFAGGFEAEANGVFFDRTLQLRLGRIRHDWGYGSDRGSLFLSSHARPFTSIEGTWLPLSWLNVTFLTGALEHFRESDQWKDSGPVSNILLATQAEFNPLPFLRVDVGGAAVLIDQPNPAFFADLEFRLPGLFSIWGGIFLDELLGENASSNGNSLAYQVGIKTVVHWLPFATFTLSYTKIEPYCYSGNWGRSFSAFASGGETLGYYLPPNSDEVLIRLEFMPLPPLKTYVQFQMIRHGVDYGYGAVPGSSIYDKLDNANSPKYFLMDGVYQWDNVIKLGSSFNLKAVGVPMALYMELGGVITNFTINGTAPVGKEADTVPLNDSVYPGVNSFIFSIGFRLFP